MFHKLLCAILFSFLFILAAVFVKAYSKKSGSTGLTMSQIQEIRLNAYK